jgi:uncharacterized protein (TIGR03435 family)
MWWMRHAVPLVLAAFVLYVSPSLRSQAESPTGPVIEGKVVRAVATGAREMILVTSNVMNAHGASRTMESRGQEQGNSAPAFDVASINEDRSGAQDGGVRFQDGRFTVTSLPVRWIIRWAYGLRDYQMTGLPNWSETRYEVQATYSPPSAGLDAVQAMAQRLLADRFALRARRAQREMRVYHLVKANDNGDLGAKLKPSDVDCEKLAAQPPALPAAGARETPSCTAWVNYGMVTGLGRTMPQLARALDDIVGAPVVDRTGLTGSWNFDMRWSVPTLNDSGAELRTPQVESIAGLFAALRDELGLKLIETRGPIDVLVIDSLSRPTPN